MCYFSYGRGIPFAQAGQKRLEILSPQKLNLGADPGLAMDGLQPDQPFPITGPGLT